MKKLNDSEILANVLEELNIRPRPLSIELGYGSPGTLYHILKGRNKMSSELIKQISDRYPVNPEYLRTGKGVIILDKSTKQAMDNLRVNNTINKSLEEIIEIGKEIINLLKEKNDKK